MEHGSGEVLLYQRDDGAPVIEVRFDAETVWLSQQQIADLFQSSRTNIAEHIKHTYEEGELNESTTCRNFRQVRTEGNISSAPGAVPDRRLTLDEAREVIRQDGAEFPAGVLYPVVKNHLLSNRNKRSAAALFVTFLALNGLLLGADGAPRITNNALAAITFMVAMSGLKEKDLVIALLIRMITEDAA